MKYLITLFLLIFTNVASCQTEKLTIHENEKRQVIDSISHLLTNYYIFPEKVPATISLLKSNFKKGRYDKYTDPREFADKINEDVISFIQDKHFRIVFDPETVLEEKKNSIYSETSTTEADKVSNFGFDQVKILNGNIGYINVTGFYNLKYAAEPLNAAMAFVQNTNAIIIDLRNNHGGASDLGPYFSGFFFDELPKLLYDFYLRDNDQTIHQQYWSSTYVNGSKLPKVDVYILTSSFTFSAAEAFAYTMQSLKRATIVGENTGGGAHMWTGKIVTDKFFSHIPYARPIDPRTETNWEGKGVVPNVICDTDKALIQAQINALVRLQVKDSVNKTLYGWHIEGLKPQLNQIKVGEETLKSYCGAYGNMKITLANGKLFFEWNGAKCEMIPLTENYFMTNEFNFFRIKIIKENESVSAIKIINDNETEREFPKAN